MNAEKQIINEKVLKELLNERSVRLVELSNIVLPYLGRTLFIIGNGFDIMHGVRSTYWNFQETLGKHCELRFHLENYLNVDFDKLWCDFEDSLSHINAGAMLNVMDMWLENFDVYKNGGDSMADFWCAVDTAMLPIQVLTEDLPRRFRMWVETLTTDGSKPLGVVT